MGLERTSITKIVKNANFDEIHHSVNSGKSISEVVNRETVRTCMQLRNSNREIVRTFSQFRNIKG